MVTPLAVGLAVGPKYITGDRSKDLSSYNRSKNGSPFSARKPVAKAPNLAAKKKAVTPPPIVKKTTPKVTPQATPAVITKPIERDIPDMIVAEKKSISPVLPGPGKFFEKRGSKVVKTIEIANPSFSVDLYDNGDIDGDSISLFYNGKLLLSRKRLSDKPISLTLETNMEEGGANELTM